jgi:hypothetical protein
MRLADYRFVNVNRICVTPFTDPTIRVCRLRLDVHERQANQSHIRSLSGHFLPVRIMPRVR